MSRCVLDASAILAVLLQEPGHERVTAALLSEAVASTVNIAEVQTKLVRRGGAPDEAWSDAVSVIRELFAFDEEQARRAGSLVTQTQTQALGLSLGDRACLALGVTLRSPIYSADKSWKKVNVGVPIHIIR
jgi:PIN domain nuclease of toxin-antitoxin system